ncbi:MAG: hypothetical protein IKG58_01515 [Bacilli bacterium]|nr:hypothetical protein [Bacilli bacterium]
MLEDYNQEFDNYIANLEESLKKIEDQIAANDEIIANRPNDNEVGEREVGGDYVSSEIIQNSHLYDVSDEINNDIENAKKIQKEVEDKFNIIEEYNKKIEEYKKEKENAPTDYLKEDYANIIEGCKKYQQELLDEINKIVPESIMAELENKKEDQTEIENEKEEEKAKENDNKEEVVETPGDNSTDEDNNDSADNEEVEEDEEEKNKEAVENSSTSDSGDSSNSEDEEETPEEERARLEAEYEKINEEIKQDQEKINQIEAEDQYGSENNNENEDEVENENDNTPNEQNEQEERREIRSTEEILDQMKRIVPIDKKSDKKYKARNIKLGKEFHKDLKEGVFGFNVLTAGVSLVKNTVKKLSGWVRSSWVDLDDAVDVQAMIWMLPPEEFKQVINDLHGEKGDELRNRYSHTLIDRFEQTYREYLTEKPEMFEDDEIPYDDEYDSEEYDNEYDSEEYDDEEVHINPNQPESGSELEGMLAEENDDTDDFEITSGRRM